MLTDAFASAKTDSKDSSFPQHCISYLTYHILPKSFYFFIVNSVSRDCGIWIGPGCVSLKQSPGLGDPQRLYQVMVPVGVETNANQGGFSLCHRKVRLVGSIGLQGCSCCCLKWFELVSYSYLILGGLFSSLSLRSHNDVFSTQAFSLNVGDRTFFLDKSYFIFKILT